MEDCKEEVEGKQNKKKKERFLSQGYGYQKSDLAEQSSTSLNKSEHEDGFLPVRMRHDCSVKTPD